MKYRLKSKETVIIDAVMVTAADYNPALSWDKAWDGCPFSEVPEWLRRALETEAIVPHNRGSTDYASWDIKWKSGVTRDEKASVGPGDWIIRTPSGFLHPCKPDLFARIFERADAGK